MLELIGARLVAFTRTTISMQGRNAPWKPLAASTKKSTGRTKALITLIPFIRYRVNNRFGVTVYFSKRPTGWSLDMHERGFTSRAVPKGVIMRAKGLGLFSGRKASKIPARRVWPTVVQSNAIIRDVSTDWIRQVVRTSWR